VLFALSCFGLLLFLWLSFGGSVPLKPQGYRVNVAFPEATQLGLEAEVRVAGVPVGNVRKKGIDAKYPNRTVATLELDAKYAPIAADSRATLRQKTLLGETYVELTPGTRGSRRVPEGGWLANARVKDTVELDEIFQALDPVTREAFRTWQRDLAGAVDGRGRDLNDAIGNLPSFAADADDVLTVLDLQKGAVQRLVKNTGVVFGALTENEGQLRNLIVNAGATFDTTARRQEALAETFRVFPTFLDESKATFTRLDRFAKDTDPLIRDLRPVARDLGPTLRDARALAPDLERFFRNLDPLITASQTGLPATREVLDGLRPVLAQVQPFLEQLNPILEWLEYHQRTTADFIANGAGALSDTIPISGADEAGGGRGHYLRQFSPKGMETVAMYNDRRQVPTARGNTYMLPSSLSGAERAQKMIYPNWDCVNTDGPQMTDKPDTADEPSCWTQEVPSVPRGNTRKFPHIDAADYSK
jgi:virulence factor Mce-like protein